MIKDYYEQFSSDHQYERLLFRTGKGLQSRELNDVQSQMIHQVKGIADVLLKDGDLTTEGDVIIDAITGHVYLGQASVYLVGLVRPVPEHSLTIALDQTIDIGVWLDFNVITEQHDPSLRDPAAGAHNFDEPGAARLKSNIGWGLINDVKAANAKFYPVHRVVNGALIVKQPSPQLDTMTSALARYDRQANGGSYVVEGMDLHYRGHNERHQTFSLKEGKAHIQGYEVAFQTARQQAFPYDPDMKTVEHEPHNFKPDDQGRMQVHLSFTPVFSVERVTVVAEKTINMTRRTGDDDPLMDDAVRRVVSVIETNQKTAKTFTDDSDYIFTKNSIRWQRDGEKPTPGSTYQVVYQYYEQLTIEHNEQGFVLEQGDGDAAPRIVADSDIAIDYTWKMPRTDLVVLDQDGTISRIKGHADAFRPMAPKAPENHLLLAKVEQTWWHTGAPNIVDLAVHSVSMLTLKQMQQQISDLYQLVAIEQLHNNANAEDPSSKYGVFVDPFLDDDLRDQGIPQTAAIIEGELQLPVLANVTDFEQHEPVILPYELANVLTQEMKTGSMKINPYQAFDPLPAAVKLQPNVDHWTQTITNWSSRITRSFVRGSGGRSRVISNSTQVERINTQTRQQEFLRTRDVTFTLQGFGPGETLERIEFDGVFVAANDQTNLTVNSGGTLRNAFTVPDNIPAGSKRVRFIGGTQSVAQATYIGSGDIRVDTMRRIDTEISQRYDPLAQTFTLEQAGFIAGVELWFTRKGSEDVRVQIRETGLGMPSQVVLAEAILPSSAIALNDVTTLFEFFPVLLNAGEEYAIVVLTDGAEHEVAIANLGEFDKQHGWVTSQPYQVGVLLSSSNASTWTPHQDKDLAFRLKRATFIQTQQEIELGEIPADNVSDLMSLAVVARPNSDTDVRFEFSVQGRAQPFNVQEWEPLNLIEPLSKPVRVKALLSGSSDLSPILFAGVQAVMGTLSQTADYISRAIPCQADGHIAVTFEMIERDNIDVYIQVANQWQVLTQPSIKVLSDGWERLSFSYADPGVAQTRIKLVLSGNAKTRPKVRSLRAFSTQ